MVAKVSRPLSFSLFTGPDSVRGSDFLLWKNNHSGTPRVFHNQENSSEGTQVHALRLFKFQTAAISSGAAHSQRGGDCDCTLVFVQQSRLEFSLKSPTSRWESGKHYDLTSWVTWQRRNLWATSADQNCLIHPYPGSPTSLYSLCKRQLSFTSHTGARDIFMWLW